MNKRSFFVENPYLVIPLLYLIASIFVDILTYNFMGLTFPHHYYFSVLIMITVCGLVTLVRKVGVQFAICVALLTVHLIAANANILSHKQLGEIISAESLLTLRQAFTSFESSLRPRYTYIGAFALLLGFFIAFSVWAMKILKRAKTSQFYEKPSYKRNLFFALAILCTTSYVAPVFYHATLGSIPIKYEVSSAYENYNNSRFAYSTFSNRLKLFKEFGQYSYYWSNIAFLLGFKSHFEYDTQAEYMTEFTLPELKENENNVIMVLFEGIEQRAINPYVMPNFYQFSQHCLSVTDYHSMNRTYNTEQASLTGLSLDTIEMHNMPDTKVPTSLPWMLKDKGYESVNAFHNFFSYFYHRDEMFESSYHFDKYYANDEADAIFNRNSDFEMMENYLLKNGEQYEGGDKSKPNFDEDNPFAPNNGDSFFTYYAAISSHSPFDISLRPRYGDNYIELEKNLTALQGLYQNLSNYTIDGYKSKSAEETMSALAGIYEYDKALGLLFDYLEFTGLIDTTTIVFYGDHYSFMGPTLLNPEGDGAYIHPAGSAIPFYIHSPVFANLTERMAEMSDGGESVRANLARIGLTPEQIEQGGAKIDKFMVNWDIYVTVCDLLHLPINSRYHLGLSIFNPTKNIGFNVKTGMVYTEDYSTFDFKTFKVRKDADQQTIRTYEDCKDRLNAVYATMHNARGWYRDNSFIDFDDLLYAW